MNPQTTTPGLDSGLPVKFLLKMAALTAIVAAILCGCAKSPRSFEQMSENEQLNYLRAQAGRALLVQATNAVPNIHSVIEEGADTFSGSINQWRGWVRVDYTDPSGRVQQTNLPMAFAATYDGRLVGRQPGQMESTLNDIVSN